MRFVYMIQFDWSTEDYGEIETELFGSYKKALARFRELVQNEKNPTLSWVGEQALDEYDNVNDGYELDFCYAEGTNNQSWHIVDNSNYYRHSFIDLIIKEIQ